MSSIRLPFVFSSLLVDKDSIQLNSIKKETVPTLGDEKLRFQGGERFPTWCFLIFSPQPQRWLQTVQGPLLYLFSLQVDQIETNLFNVSISKQL